MKKVYEMMKNAVSGGVFPGAVLFVSESGRTLFHEAFGLADIYENRKATPGTVFDLASLTKPLATTLAVMKLEEEGVLEAGRAASDFIPELLDTDKSRITIRQLLCHSSGFPAYVPYYKTLLRHPESERKVRLRQMLAAEPLGYPPGTGCEYSDLGFMVLCWVVENVSGKTLGRYVEDDVYGPMGVKDIYFSESPFFCNNRDMLASTEKCSLRKSVLNGIVHDENAWAAGGAEGHAGLFGTARDVALLLNEMLEVFHGVRGRGVFRQRILAEYLRKDSVSGRALGFDMPSRPDSSSGKFFSDNSVGHLGFTGTSFWLDMDRRVAVVLLTNRVHPSRENVGIRQFRPVIHDAVMTELGYGE